jgi:hypothetical protein
MLNGVASNMCLKEIPFSLLQNRVNFYFLAEKRKKVPNISHTVKNNRYYVQFSKFDNTYKDISLQKM